MFLERRSGYMPCVLRVSRLVCQVGIQQLAILAKITLHVDVRRIGGGAYQHGRLCARAASADGASVAIERVEEGVCGQHLGLGDVRGGERGEDGVGAGGVDDVVRDAGEEAVKSELGEAALGFGA